MRNLVRPAVGLVASLVLAGSAVSALVLVYTLAKEGIASGGDIAEWGERLRHYTDTLTVEPDGSLRVDEASSPLLQMAGVLMAAVFLAVGASWLVRISTSAAHLGQTKPDERRIRMARTFVPLRDYAGRSVALSRWPAPPMDSGAPMPALRRAGHDLVVAYVSRNPDFPGWDSGVSPDHPGFEVFCTAIRFEEVAEHYIGPPNDEALHLHPLYGIGLGAYDFFEVHGSPKAVSGNRHWIVTFHDETLEVVARRLSIVAERVSGEETADVAQRFASLPPTPTRAT